MLPRYVHAYCIVRRRIVQAIVLCVDVSFVLLFMYLDVTVCDSTSVSIELRGSHSSDLTCIVSLFSFYSLLVCCICSSAPFTFPTAIGGDLVLGLGDLKSWILREDRSKKFASLCIFFEPITI